MPVSTPFKFNHDKIFSSIKLLVVNSEKNNINSFVKGMTTNYHMSENPYDILNDDEDNNELDHEQLHKDIEEFSSLVYWEDRDVADIDTLPVGTVFKGICKADSMMRSYMVVGKFNDVSIWFPLEPDRAEYVGILYELDTEAKEFKVIGIDTIDNIRTSLELEAEPNTIYRVTDVNGNPVSLIDSDDDEDETDPVASMYFVYKKDEYENAILNINELVRVMDKFQIFRPMLNVLREVVEKENSVFDQE